MGLEDIFGFDAPAYAARMSSCPMADLQQREKVKTRQLTSSGLCTVAATAAGSVTFGVSLLAAGYSVRRLNIALQKLEVIQAELKKRNVPLRTFHISDIAIPVALTAGTCGVAHGFEHIAHEAASNAINASGTAAAHSTADATAQALNHHASDVVAVEVVKVGANWAGKKAIGEIENAVAGGQSQAPRSRKSNGDEAKKSHPSSFQGASQPCEGPRSQKERIVKSYKPPAVVQKSQPTRKQQLKKSFGGQRQKYKLSAGDYIRGLAIFLIVVGFVGRLLYHVTLSAKN